jgi:hypothetical protein
MSFGFLSTSGINLTITDRRSVFEVELNNPETKKDLELVLGDGSVMKCSFRSKKSTVRSVENGSLSVSIGSNWVCK